MQPVTWRGFVIAFAVGGTALAIYNRERRRITYEVQTTRQGPSLGKAAVGGPFELMNTDGQVVTDKDFRGKFMLIYFGFTSCPDVCPEEMAKISEALDSLPSGIVSKVRPIFISVDPDRYVNRIRSFRFPFSRRHSQSASISWVRDFLFCRSRDDRQKVAKYLAENFPRFQGLTGTAEQIKTAAKAYRVYYSKDNTPGDEYLVDHSIITYLMGPDGSFVEHYGRSITAQDMALRMNNRILETRF